MADTTPDTLAQHEHEPIYRRNFVYFLIDNILFSVAMSVISPTTLIPDFIRHLTRSEVLIGFSSSIFDVGWSLPQLFIARYIVRFERKKWWFIGPNIPVRFAIFLFSILTMVLGKDRPQAILIAFLVCYGMAAFGDGLVGVPWAVLSGTCLDSRWRARMFGLTSAITGVIMLGVSPLIGLILGSAGPAFPNNYAMIFGISGVLFVISVFPFFFVHEITEGNAVEKLPSLAEFIPSIGRILKRDISFRSMILTRMFFSLFSMAGPFYIGFATVQLGLSSTVAVPVLLAMQTVGAVSGSLVYTWLGARNNLMYIRLGLGMMLFLPVSALLASVFGPIPLYIGFLISGLTMNNLFLSFLNWVISNTTPDLRPIYTGIFNTISALISLLAPFIAGTIAQHLGYEALFAVALVMGLLAVFITLRYVSDRSPGSEMDAAATDSAAAD
jgi:MFS family permease